VQGVVYEGRDDLTRDNYLSEVAVPTHKRTLQEAVEGADVFLGLSVSTTPAQLAWVFLNEHQGMQCT
jgi:malate dehydrogenase (oxaloacetate-decarboxylating)(NADP+)